VSFLKKKLFLSKAERDSLTSSRQFDDDYSYTIKSRLIKKIIQFTNQELPLLIEKGYLTEVCKLTDNCKVQQGEGASLVKIPPQTGDKQLSYECIITKTARKSGPKGIRTLDPRHVKAVS
jgi:hypothetical protein